MTEEQIKAQSKIPREFKNVRMGEPYKQHDDCPEMGMPPLTYRPPNHQQTEGRMRRADATQLPEDRMYRVGVSEYVVWVFDDPNGDHRTYLVNTTSSLAARCIAFILDGGCEAGLTRWRDGHLELALNHTEIVG